MVLCQGLGDRDKSHRVRRFISVNIFNPQLTQTHNQTFCAVSHCLDYKCKIKGVLVAACIRALRRPAYGNLVYQITRSVPIAVILMACTTEMIVTEICEPTSITDQ